MPSTAQGARVARPRVEPEISDEGIVADERVVLQRHQQCGRNHRPNARNALQETDSCLSFIAGIYRGGDLGVERFDQRLQTIHDPLELTLSQYPDFRGAETYEYTVSGTPLSHPVEVDLYEVLSRGCEVPVYLGVDIGSTSTKAVLLADGGRVLAGFYTATAGRPVAAVQRVFSSIEDMQEKKGIGLRFLGAATTGSGRKFAGKIIGADIVLDEITAHARAACEIDPEVDTIIEIGGQDSKFTTLN